MLSALQNARSPKMPRLVSAQYFLQRPCRKNVLREKGGRTRGVCQQLGALGALENDASDQHPIRWFIVITTSISRASEPLFWTPWHQLYKWCTHTQKCTRVWANTHIHKSTPLFRKMERQYKNCKVYLVFRKENLTLIYFDKIWLRGKKTSFQSHEITILFSS